LLFKNIKKDNTLNDKELKINNSDNIVNDLKI